MSSNHKGIEMAEETTNTEQTEQTETNYEKLFKDMKSNNDTLIERVTFLEKDIAQASKKREKAKEELKEVKESKSQENTAEVDNIKNQLEESNKLRNDISKEFNQYKETQALEQAIQQAGVSADAANPETFAIITSLLKSGIKVEDGEVGYQNPDGTTLYNDGKAVSIAERLESIKNNEAYAGLFKPSIKIGSGSSQSKGYTGQGQYKPGMKAAEKAELMKKVGSEKYLEMVKNHKD